MELQQHNYHWLNTINNTDLLVTMRFLIKKTFFYNIINFHFLREEGIKQVRTTILL